MKYSGVLDYDGVMDMTYVCVNMILTVLVLTVALVVVLALLWSNLLGGPTCKVGVPYTSALSIHRSVCLSIRPSVCHRTKH